MLHFLSCARSRRLLLSSLVIGIPFSFDFAANVAAQDRPSVAGPSPAVGDRWTWNVEVSPRDDCSDAIPKGAQEIETVIRVNDDSYVTETVSPFATTKYSRTYAKDGSYKANLDGKEIRPNPVAFPLRPGNKWETTLVSARVVTSLECEAEKPERMTAGSENLEVIPVTCNGSWKNRQFNNGDVATYKYWYSPVVGASVRRTVWTRYRGKTCADIEYRLESFARTK
jgi:hypothetical protein